MGGASRSCQDAADTLKRCLASSDCVKKEGNSMEHCVKVVEECMVSRGQAEARQRRAKVLTGWEGGKLYRNAYVICKRHQMDPRSRIQGLKGA